MKRLGACAVIAFACARCASPLTIAEPRDGGSADGSVGTFGDAGPLEAGEGGDADFIADPPSDGAADG